MTNFILIRYWPGSSGRALANILLSLVDHRCRPFPQGHSHSPGHNIDFGHNLSQLDPGQLMIQNTEQFEQNFQWNTNQQLVIIDSHHAETAPAVISYLETLGPTRCVDIVFEPEDCLQINYNFVVKAVAGDKLGHNKEYLRSLWQWTRDRHPLEYPEFREDDLLWQAQMMTRTNREQTWLDMLNCYPSRRTIDYAKIRQGLAREDLEFLVNGLEIDNPDWEHALAIGQKYAQDQKLYDLPLMVNSQAAADLFVDCANSAERPRPCQDL